MRNGDVAADAQKRELSFNAKDGIREFNVLFPVEIGNVVLAGSLVIADRRADGRVDVRLFRNAANTVCTEQTVDRIGVKSGQEFAFRVGPEVFACAGDVNRTRSDQGDKFMFVHGEVVNAISVRTEVFREPMGERFVNGLNRFAKFTARKSRASAPGVVRDDAGEPFVVSAAP